MARLNDIGGSGAWKKSMRKVGLALFGLLIILSWRITETAWQTKICISRLGLGFQDLDKPASIPYFLFKCASI